MLCGFNIINIYSSILSCISLFYRNESFENCLDKIYGVEKELYILCDFNRGLFNTNIKRNWLDFISLFGLHQMVNQATRVTTRSATLIDHIYCNIQENCSNINVPKLIAKFNRSLSCNFHA